MNSEKYRNGFFSIICRKKSVPAADERTPLKKCLTTLDLILLEIGYMIGSGIFLFAGATIKDKVGPGIILSFVVAAVPAFISALCYAEFGARIPKAGSTYDYVYVALGEFWAALVGWYFVSSAIFWNAAGALALSSYFDALFNGLIRNRTIEVIGSFNTPYLSPYPDFLACGIVVLSSVIIASGAKLSALVNNVFSFIKLGVILFIIAYGFSFANFQYWTDPKEGGFLPYGFAGVMAAAPDCLFAFVGFEAATTAGEEAKNPQKSIVLAMATAFVIAITAYILMCASLTLMLPYQEISPTSSFADAFAQRGAYWAKYVVAIGALSALTTVNFGNFFSMARYIYAVSSDGLIFRWLGKVNSRTGVPVLAILIFAVFSVGVVLLLDLEQLVEFLAMGSLLCYTLVPASLIIMRYRPRAKRGSSRAGYLREKFTGTRLDQLLRNDQPGVAVRNLVIAQSLIMIACAAIIARANWKSSIQFYAFLVILILLAIGLLVMQLLIMAFEQNDNENQWFRTPFVPFFPSISMFINILMILYLTPVTWLRFGLYLGVGVAVYFLYGIRHSVHKSKVGPASHAEEKTAF